MPDVTQNDFSQGWIPSDDYNNGRKNGLLRMDNLTLEEIGSVSLARGTEKVNASELSGAIHSLYSSTLGGTKRRYVGLTDESVKRDSGGGTYGVTILSSGGGAAGIRTAFGSGFNFTFIVSGSEKKKDNGTTVYDLGVTTPADAVATTGATPPSKDAFDSFSGTVLAEGANLGATATGFEADTDPTTFRLDAYVEYGSAINTMDFGSDRFGTPDDVFLFDLRIPDLAKFRRIIVIVFPDGADPDDPQDYYRHVWEDNDDSLVRDGSSQWSVMKAVRKNWEKVGTDNTFSWANIGGVRVTVQYTEDVADTTFANFRVIGSAAGPLNGGYEYLQVDVGNNGAYLARSEHGPFMDYYHEVSSSYISVTPDTPTDPQVNEIWIYRRKVLGEGGDPSGDFQLVYVQTSSLGSAFDDQVSDVAAQQLNTPLNLFLKSVQNTAYFPDDVYYMEVNYFTRTLYMSPREILISEPLCPDLIDIRHTIKLSGDFAELNLWMIKVSNSSLLVGTNKDIHEIAGTLNELPDGLLDQITRSLGIKQPPISDTVCVESNNVYYIAQDGLRSIVGATTGSFNGNLDLFWRGETRYGHLPCSIITFSSAYYLEINKNRIFFSTTLSDTSRRIFVYDIARQYWYPYYINANCLFTEEDGTLVGGFSDEDDWYVRILDIGDDLDGEVGQSINLLTPAQDGNLPRNRKDSYTLKLKINTGGDNVTVKIYKDEETSATSVTTTCSSSGLSEQKFDISSIIGVCKSYRLEITATDLTAFELVYWTIECDLRPTQVTHLRLPPSNWGTASRKRIPLIPLLIDTLGANVTFTPVLDTASETTSTINTADKKVAHHFFTADKAAYDIGGILHSPSGAYFEFYEQIPPRNVEILPDPAKYFKIPNNNLGTPSRKRMITVVLVIDTKGANVTFTPTIDGASQTAATINTSGKRTYTYYFTSDVKGVDVGGILETAANTEFEFYEIDIDESLSEKLPVPTRFLIIPEDNFGVPARKRVRTIPIEIDTRGQDVTWTPTVDGADQTPLTLNTTSKRTVFYYFTTDSFGIDYGGRLEATTTTPFEFYKQHRPVDVQILPVAKRFDQAGPIEIMRLGKLRMIRIRLVPTTTVLNFNIFVADASIYTGTHTVVANVDNVYDIPMPKGVNGTVFRVEFAMSAPFHRYYVHFLVNSSGADSDSKWMKFGADPDAQPK